MDARTFYDQFVGRQVAAGINERHRAIVAWLQRFGLRRDHSVLEVGCGVGTLTQLLADYLGDSGSVLAVDLSPRSVEAAEQRLASFDNVRFMVADATELQLDRRFDVVVLPDTIEHIPLDRHPALFERLASWVEPRGFVLLHYPDPHYLQWCHEHEPEGRQIIDQPIRADALLANAYASGLHLDFLESYAIWVREGDYVVAVLRPEPGVLNFNPLPERSLSLPRRVAARARLLRQDASRRRSP